MLAKPCKAAKHYSPSSFAQGRIAKLYWAIVAGFPGRDSGTWTDVLAKDSGQNRTHVMASGESGGKSIRSTQGAIAHFTQGSKLELLPLSGRSHQLRVQLASRGLPILGDIKYGSGIRLNAADQGARIALHAQADCAFTHPTRREAITIAAPVPEGVGRNPCPVGRRQVFSRAGRGGGDVVK